VSVAREQLRRIAIAGDGPLGVLAAIALKRALPTTDIVIIGTPPDPAALAERSATALPFTSRLHDKLGVPEEELVKRCGASHRLVTRYLGWGGAEHEGLASYGAEIDPKLNTGFARHWGVGPRNASAATPPGSLAEVLAAAGRYAPPQPDGSLTLPGVEAALRWNIPAYRDLLVGKAQQLGLRHVSGAIAAVEPDGSGGAASVSVAGGLRIPADLFIDCSGPGAAMLSQLPGFRSTDYSARLPATAIVETRPRAPMLALEDRIVLAAAGWRWDLAGRDGAMAWLGIAAGVDPEKAAAGLGLEPVSMVRVTPGRAAEPWLGNVVALGDAAARLEPLGGFALDLSHRQLDLLLDVLPGRPLSPLERAEFNRRAGLMADRAGDVLGAHYAAPMARAAFGERALSDELAMTLDQHVRRGRVPFFEETPLLTRETGSLLDALGFAVGEGALARAEGADDGEARAGAFAARARAALGAVPPYREWMERLVRG